MKKNQAFVSVTQKYFQQDPVAAARTLETMPEEDAIEIFKFLPASVVAEAMKYLNDSYAASLMERLPEANFAQITAYLDSEKTTSILMQVSSEKREVLLGIIDEKKKSEIQELLTYPEGSAGRLMTTKVIAFNENVLQRDAIQKIRRLSAKGFPDSYIYVVDEGNHLKGVMNMRDMLLAHGTDKLAQHMRTDVLAIDCFADSSEILAKLKEHHFFAAPVVDANKRLLGIIKTENLIKEIKESTTEDIQKMVGASGHERAFSPIKDSIKSRLPWLHINLATAFLAASVVSLFEDIIAKITVLAIYLPVVAGQGGNAGAQSLAVVMRGIVMREIPPAKVKALIIKESTIGLINGVVVGIVTGLVAWFWKSNPMLGFVIGLGMLINLVVAGFAGAFIPIAMKSLRLDPAQSSSIILTTITDIVGFFAFLGLAVIFQRFLI